MSPTIRVDDAVYEALKDRAEPFVDTPNSVLRRMLGLDQPDSGLEREAPVPHERRSRQRSRLVGPGVPRANSADLLPASAYRGPVLRALAQKGGSAPSAEVIEMVGQELNDSLTPTDREELASGTIRWPNRVSWMRHLLASEGLIEKGSPRGTWSLTPAGLEAAKAAGADYSG